MIWKLAAEEKLSQYPAQVAAVQNLQAQLKLLESRTGGLHSPQYDRPVVSTSHGRTEDALLEQLVKKQEMEWSLAQAQTWVEVTQRALDTLTAEDRQVLQTLYMDPDGGVEALCSRMNKDRTTAYRHRERALRKFTMALYGS